MSKVNIIDKVEASKLWGYLAMAGAFVAVAGIVIVAKEVYEAREAAKNKSLAEAELKTTKEEAGIPAEASTEGFSGCGGCSNATGGKRERIKPQMGYVTT